MVLQYFEDIQLHQTRRVGEYLVDKDEAIEFARLWDPQPFHLDEETAKAYPAGGLIVSALYTLGVMTRLAFEQDTQTANLIGFGWDNVRFLNAVRPGDRISMFFECTEKRESKSRPDAGIIRYAVEVKNQNGDVCLSLEGANMVAKRPQ